MFGFGFCIWVSFVWVLVFSGFVLIGFGFCVGFVLFRFGFCLGLCLTQTTGNPLGRKFCRPKMTKANFGRGNRSEGSSATLKFQPNYPILEVKRVLSATI